MARLASEVKKGFYPTSILTIEKIIEKTLVINEKMTVLDSCCGEGEALEFFTTEYGCKTYGVELDVERAKVAAERKIEKALNACSLSGVRKSARWASINFLNPPYGTDSFQRRIEHEFIQNWSSATIIGGIMMLVINDSAVNDDLFHLLRKKGLNPISSYFDDTNEDYKKFGQFFVLLKQEVPEFRTNYAKLEKVFNNSLNINTVEIENKLEIKEGLNPKLFKEIHVPEWKIEEIISKSNLVDSFFKDLNDTKVATRTIETPNEGQLAQLVASGVLNDVIVLNDGVRAIIKGTVEKESYDGAVNMDNEIHTVKVGERYKTVFYMLDLTHGGYAKFK